MAAPPIPQRRPPPPPPEFDDEDEEEEVEDEAEKTENSFAMHKFTDGDEDMSVQVFFQQYSHRLPQVVVVSQGQYGDIDLDTFCGGQVMYIHSFATQTRVVARDVRGRTFSIPEDYPLKFKVVKSRTKEGDEQSLSEILKEIKLPQQVKFSVPSHVTFYIGPDQQRAKDLSNLVLVESYAETYMIANCINTKSLDKKTILVPVYLKDALFSMVNGIENEPKEVWQQYQAQLAEELKTVDMDIKIGNKDIAFLSEDVIDDVDNVYDYIEPKNFLKMSVTDESGYGVILDDPDSIYTAVDENDVKPPLPKRKTSTDKETGKAEKSGKSDKPELPSRNKITEKDKSKTTGSTEAHGYVNDIPRKEVAPMKIFKGLTLGRKHDDVGKTEETHENVSIEELSIVDLGKKMKALKLDKHVAVFKKQQIDGSIALELTKDILQSDFGFTAVEAIKMMQFIKTGHIPK